MPGLAIASLDMRYICGTFGLLYTLNVGRAPKCCKHSAEAFIGIEDAELCIVSCTVCGMTSTGMFAQTFLLLQPQLIAWMHVGCPLSFVASGLHRPCNRAGLNAHTRIVQR